MNEKEKTKFLPFHAINEFMRNDFRIQVLRSALTSLPETDKKTASKINRLTKRHVKVAGFRNSTKAPATVKAVAMVKPFEKQPDLVAAILQAWSLSKPELCQQMFDLLCTRGWKLLPLEADRTRMPGFLTKWPLGEDYDTLFDAFSKIHPDHDYSIDETSLMVVYLSGRLPIEKVDMEELTELDSMNSVLESSSEKSE